MEEILASTTEVAEGVDTSIALVKMIKERCKGYRLDLKYPIIFGVANILLGLQTPREGLQYYGPLYKFNLERCDISV